MRKITLFFLALVVLCAAASAHSGRTDASGGHYDRATGEYHFHHGFPAHQHTDGVCPYDFVDRTGAGSGSGPGRAASASSGNGPSGIMERKEAPSFLAAVGSVLGPLCLPALPFAAWAAANIAKEPLKRRKRYRAERKKYAELYQGKSLLALSGAPEGAWLDNAGNPHMKAPGSTDVFTVFVTASGACYHKSGCARMKRGAPRKINVRLAQKLGKLPCSCCKPMETLPEWVTECERIRCICRQYAIRVDP